MAITPGSGPKAAHYTDIGPSYHGIAVKLAAADMFQSGDSRIVWIGDSYASKVNSGSPAFSGRVAQSFARRANFAGKITAYTTTPRDNGAGTLNTDDVAVYEFGGTSVAAHRTAGIVRVEPNSSAALWAGMANTASTTVVNASVAPVWGAFYITHVIGTIGDETLTAIHANAATANDTYELFRIDHKTTDGNGKFATEFETPDGSSVYMGARVGVSVPTVPWDNTNTIYFRGAGITGPTGVLSLGGIGNGSAIYVQSGPYHLGPPETAGYIQAATRGTNGVSGTALRYQRVLFAGVTINGADAVVVNADIDGLAADGDPNLVCRIKDTEYDAQADTGKWFCCGPVTLYTCETDGTPRRGIYIDHQFGIGSAQWADLYTNAAGTPPGTGSTSGSKSLGPNVLGDVLVAHTLRADQPLTVFVDFQDEALGESTTATRIGLVLNGVRDALLESGSRFTGLEDLPLRIIIVHSYISAIGGSYNISTIAPNLEASWRGIKTAVDTFNAAGNVNATAGAVSLYGASNGILFGDVDGSATNATHTWSGNADLENEAAAWIAAQGVTAQQLNTDAQAGAWDQLDPADVHLMFDGANFMAELVEGSLRASLGGGGSRSRLAGRARWGR